MNQARTAQVRLDDVPGVHKPVSNSAARSPTRKTLFDDLTQPSDAEMYLLHRRGSRISKFSSFSYKDFEEPSGLSRMDSQHSGVLGRTVSGWSTSGHGLDLTAGLKKVFDTFSRVPEVKMPNIVPSDPSMSQGADATKALAETFRRRFMTEKDDVTVSANYVMANSGTGRVMSPYPEKRFKGKRKLRASIKYSANRNCSSVEASHDGSVVSECRSHTVETEGSVEKMYQTEDPRQIEVENLDDSRIIEAKTSQPFVHEEPNVKLRRLERTLRTGAVRDPDVLPKKSEESIAHIGQCARNPELPMEFQDTSMIVLAMPAEHFEEDEVTARHDRERLSTHASRNDATTCSVKMLSSEEDGTDCMTISEQSQQESSNEAMEPGEHLGTDDKPVAKMSAESYDRGDDRGDGGLLRDPNLIEVPVDEEKGSPRNSVANLLEAARLRRRRCQPARGIDQPGDLNPESGENDDVRVDYGAGDARMRHMRMTQQTTASTNCETGRTTVGTDWLGKPHAFDDDDGEGTPRRRSSSLLRMNRNRRSPSDEKRNARLMKVGRFPTVLPARVTSRTRRFQGVPRVPSSLSDDEEMKRRSSAPKMISAHPKQPPPRETSSPLPGDFPLRPTAPVRREAVCDYNHHEESRRVQNQLIDINKQFTEQLVSIKEEMESNKGDQERVMKEQLSSQQEKIDQLMTNLAGSIDKQFQTLRAEFRSQCDEIKHREKKAWDDLKNIQAAALSDTLDSIKMSQTTSGVTSNKQENELIEKVNKLAHSVGKLDERVKVSLAQAQGNYKNDLHDIRRLLAAQMASLRKSLATQERRTQAQADVMRREMNTFRDSMLLSDATQRNLIEQMRSELRNSSSNWDRLNNEMDRRFQQATANFNHSVNDLDRRVMAAEASVLKVPEKIDVKTCEVEKTLSIFKKRMQRAEHAIQFLASMYDELAATEEKETAKNYAVPKSGEFAKSSKPRQPQKSSGYNSESSTKMISELREKMAQKRKNMDRKKSDPGEEDGKEDKGSSKKEDQARKPERKKSDFFMSVKDVVLLGAARKETKQPQQAKAAGDFTAQEEWLEAELCKVIEDGAHLGLPD